MTTIFHIWPYGRFIEVQRNLRRKKLHGTNQGSNFLGGGFSNRDNVGASVQFGRESQLQQHLKRYFSSRTDHRSDSSSESEFSLWRKSVCQTLSKSLDISSATTWVALDLLEVLAILSDATVRISAVDQEDLKPYWK